MAGDRGDDGAVVLRKELDEAFLGSCGVPLEGDLSAREEGIRLVLRAELEVLSIRRADGVAGTVCVEPGREERESRSSVRDSGAVLSLCSNGANSSLLPYCAMAQSCGRSPPERP